MLMPCREIDRLVKLVLGPAPEDFPPSWAGLFASGVSGREVVCPPLVDPEHFRARISSLKAGAKEHCRRVKEAIRALESAAAEVEKAQKEKSNGTRTIHPSEIPDRLEGPLALVQPFLRGVPYLVHVTDKEALDRYVAYMRSNAGLNPSEEACPKWFTHVNRSFMEDGPQAWVYPTWESFKNATAPLFVMLQLTHTDALMRINTLDDVAMGRGVNIVGHQLS